MVKNRFIVRWGWTCKAETKEKQLIKASTCEQLYKLWPQAGLMQTWRDWFMSWALRPISTQMDEKYVPHQLYYERALAPYQCRAFCHFGWPHEIEMLLWLCREECNPRELSSQLVSTLSRLHQPNDGRNPKILKIQISVVQVMNTKTRDVSAEEEAPGGRLYYITAC